MSKLYQEGHVDTCIVKTTKDSNSQLDTIQENPIPPCRTHLFRIHIE
jgi:hypothetical protein